MITIPPPPPPFLMLKRGSPQDPYLKSSALSTPSSAKFESRTQKPDHPKQSCTSTHPRRESSSSTERAWPRCYTLHSDVCERLEQRGWWERAPPGAGGDGDEESDVLDACQENRSNDDQVDLSRYRLRAGTTPGTLSSLAGPRRPLSLAALASRDYHVTESRIRPSACNKRKLYERPGDGERTDR